ncbi:MAG TPA: substrate-binding domain-containing protein [Nocardioidaceae bacterium]|nr:substrate-binding domain-containing protein [Nocardioidaceae bacterium]
MDRGEFEAHPLWAAVEELQRLLVRADEIADPAHFEKLDQLRYEQLRYVVKSVRSHRPPPEATAAARAKLDGLHGRVRAAATELAAFASDRDGAHLTVAVGLVDRTLLDLGVEARAPRPSGHRDNPEPQPTPMSSTGGPGPGADATPTSRLPRARHVRRTRDRTIVSGAGVIALVVAAIGSVLASGNARTGSEGVTAKVSSAACTVLRVVSTSSYLPALDSVADELARGDDCVYLDLTVADGRDAARVVEAEHAHVWIADDAAWLSQESGAGGSGEDRYQTLAASPVLFASGREMATAVDEAGGGWSGLAALIDSGAPVRIVTADPAASGDGLVAVGGLGDAVRGTPGLDAALLLDRAFRDHRATRQLVGSGIAADEIALVPEHLLGGAVAAQGVITVPDDGAVLMRYSWYPTSVDADAPPIRSARSRLLAALTEGATAEQARVAAHLRDPRGRPPTMTAPGMWGDPRLAPATPVLDAHRVERVLATWYVEDRRADLLVVVDASAAMAASAPGSRRPLITLVRDNVMRLAGRMPDDARLGVWGFRSRLRGASDPIVVDPVRPLTSTHRSGLDAALNRLVARGIGGGFYDAVLAAYRSALSDRWSDVDFRVLVLTAGSSADDPGSLSVDELRTALARVASADVPVELTVVKVGRGPTQTLDRALRPVGGDVVTVGSAASVVAAFARLAVGDLHE